MKWHLPSRKVHQKSPVFFVSFTFKSPHKQQKRENIIENAVINSVCISMFYCCVAIICVCMTNTSVDQIKGHNSGHNRSFLYSLSGISIAWQGFHLAQSNDFFIRTKELKVSRLDFYSIFFNSPAKQAHC